MSHHVLQEVLVALTGNHIKSTILSHDGIKRIYFMIGDQLMSFSQLPLKLKTNNYLSLAYEDLKEELDIQRSHILEDSIRQLKYAMVTWDTGDGKLDVERILACPLLRKYILTRL
ncbi:MAG: hypothetical protein K0U52_05865 [Gammaproteobacteria bacterium]|nr:hypothetical protein [Gammaproteobacteria bacterium]